MRTTFKSSISTAIFEHMCSKMPAKIEPHRFNQILGMKDQQPCGGGKRASVKRCEKMHFWTSTFKALGNVVHLVQDAAQPQHAIEYRKVTA
jgi:hypothetical protein